MVLSVHFQSGQFKTDSVLYFYVRVNQGSLKVNHQKA